MKNARKRGNRNGTDYDGDPVLGDEDDPDYREEMFETFKSMGWTPRDIKEPKYRKLYTEWLKKQGAFGVNDELDDDSAVAGAGDRPYLLSSTDQRN